MLKLATLIENPGEPTVATRYHDPHHLKRLGYNGLVVYETTALSGLENPDLISNAEMKRWVGHHIDRVTRTIDEAHDAGLAVYVFYDTPVLARDVVERNVGALTCKNRSEVLCPASEHTLERSTRGLEAMLGRWPRVEGVVLRFGDTDAGRMPHLVGNDLYSPHCPRCSQFGRADRIVAILDRFRRLVVDGLGKRLIARAWNVRPNGLHDSVDLAKRVVERLAETASQTDADDPRFMLSFKFTHTDFWRYQKWNAASLVCDRIPILYELQCQREFEGKGGLPNWQVPLWRDGYPETREQTEVSGLAAASGKVNLAGLWAWVRGGGWGGPFIKNETWIDANVFAVPRLADNPQADPRELGRAWIDERLGITEPPLVQKLLEILEASPAIAQSMFYIGPFARMKSDQWHPSGDWISDDLLDAHGAWRIVQRLPESQLDAVVAEKESAVEQLSRLRAELQHLISDRNHATLEPLVNTLTYGESLAESLRDLLAGLVAYRRYLRNREPQAASLTRQKLFAAQSHWNHHTQRHGSLPGAATAFRETHFWDLTQQILGEVS
jgi:hypothetical protein